MKHTSKIHRFSVWAPQRKKISLKLDDRDFLMEGPSEHGWWSTEVEHAAHGSDYSFLVDDIDYSYPDPRSLWQPNGVHAASRVYDHLLFQWNDADWNPPLFASAVIYELHLGTFTDKGTLDSAIERLDYLVSLGITHVELMPIAAFDGTRGWGYDGVALYAPAEIYGGPDATKRFVDACHQRGLAVLLDVVYNHFGPVGNYTGVFGPYTTDAHQTPWGSAMNFEGWGSDQVRRFFIDNALMWMRDYHFDGLRLDAVHTFVDRSALHFLEQLSSEVESLSTVVGRKLTLIAESDLNDPRVVTPREALGYGMDVQWSDDFHHSLFALLTGEKGGYYRDFGKIADLAKALKQVFVYDGRYSHYRNLTHGRPVGDLSFHRFLGYIQNHDQIGNRAKGDRLAAITGIEKARLAAAVVLLAPFVPMIFQGEEWAASTPFQYFVDHQDEELRKGVFEGRKREFAAFGWDPSEIADPGDPRTFRSCILNWNEPAKGRHKEILDWYRSLIHLRRTTPSLNLGDAGQNHVTYSDEELWLTTQRGSVRVLYNFAAVSRRFDIPAEATIRLTSHEGIVLSGVTIELPAYGVAVLQLPSNEEGDSAA